MSRELNLLEPDFEKKVRKLLVQCEKDGYPMKPFYTLRSVYDQAKLYRQSRPFFEIEGASTYLKERGAPYLASVLIDVGPCSGNWATNALPGYSWHQHGEAVDCYWYIDKTAEWSTSRKHEGKNGYDVYAENAAKLGLVSGHLWAQKDSVHVQKTSGSIRLLIDAGSMSLSELDSKMKDTFDV